MTAVVRPLKIEQGATFTLGFVWHHEGPVVNGEVTPGEPYNLTGWVARMQIRKTQQSPVLVDASSTNGKITLGGITGRVDIELSDDDTDLLTTRTALYDLELEDPDGKVYRLLQGSVTVDPNITQEADDPIVSA